jgi:inosose dehydratase
MSQLGLRATELGPKGYLPADPGRLRELVAAHELDVVGGFLPFAMNGSAALEERVADVATYADLLAAIGCRVLILAAGDASTAYESSRDLDDEGWAALVRTIGGVDRVASERGLTVAVHPHHGTYIERPQEVHRLLETSSVDLCLDTGHVLVGGGDPHDLARDAAGRIAHVHLKDASAELAEGVATGRHGYAAAVREGMYRPLGAGDLDVSGIVRTLHDSGYGGWYVLEQDTILDAAPEEGDGPVRDASASVEFLRRVESELDGDPAGAAGRRGRRRMRRPW